MKVGDRVRSILYKKDLEGVVQEIGPCDYEDCNKTSFTFDPSGPEAVRSFHHAENFEVVRTDET